MWRSRTNQTCCELVQVGLANQHGASGKQLRHYRCTLVRDVGEGRAARAGGHTRHINVVFHREGDAPERIFHHARDLIAFLIAA